MNFKQRYVDSPVAMVAAPEVGMVYRTSEILRGLWNQSSGGIPGTSQTRPGDQSALRSKLVEEWEKKNQKRTEVEWTGYGY